MVNQINSGDTAWILVCCSLVLLMTPALALFYGGMVRRKNVLSTIAHSTAAMAIVTVLWFIAGYSLSFGSGGAVATELRSVMDIPVASFVGGLGGRDITLKQIKEILGSTGKSGEGLTFVGSRL